MVKLRTFRIPPSIRKGWAVTDPRYKVRKAPSERAAMDIARACSRLASNKNKHCFVLYGGLIMSACYNGRCGEW